jgi:hypothetical protein
VTNKTVYTDIKDMYMTTETLSKIKTGTCTERRPMEAAILRKSGIAARTATRSAHIFTEIYIPDTGWISTSPLLNEIPLCESIDEGQSYFIEWTPKSPVRVLHWSGILYPQIIF